MEREKEQREKKLFSDFFRLIWLLFGCTGERAAHRKEKKERQKPGKLARLWN